MSMIVALPRGLDTIIKVTTQHDSSGVVKSAPADKEEENLIATLSGQNSKLKSQYGTIIEKNKQLVELLEKKKREISTLKRSIQTKGKANTSMIQSRENLIPQDVEIRAAATHFTDKNNQSTNLMNVSTAPPPLNPAADANLLEIARKYKAR